MTYNKKHKSYKTGRSTSRRRSSSDGNLLRALPTFILLVSGVVVVGLNLGLKSFLFPQNKTELNESIVEGINTEVEEVTKVRSDEKIYQRVDEKPAFPSCEDIEHEDKKKHCSVNKVRSFIYNNFEYPAEYIGKGGGILTICFVIDKNGNVVDPGVYKDPNNLGDIVLKALPMMPPWIPGKRAGVPVNTEMYLTIDVDERQYIVSDSYDPLKSDDGNLIAPMEMAYFVGCEGMTNGEKEMCNKRHITKKKHNIYGSDHVSLFRNYYMRADHPTLTFVVTKQGNIANIKAGCREESYNKFLEDKLRNMQWIPARYKGKPINVELFFPCGTNNGY